MQDSLEDLAIDDGYTWTLTPEERQAIREAEGYPGWYQNGQITVEQRDLGISGTKGQEERPGLAHLRHLIEEDQVEALYVVHISRLFRDQTLINAFEFGELCKEFDVKIVTPTIRLNLRLPMHMEYYRREADWSAKELEVMKARLIDAKTRKAQQGRWVGGNIPAGYMLDERREVDGRANPDWHKYQPYEPHARVIRIIFDRLRSPGMTGGRVARWCYQQGIRFEPFPPEMATRYNALCFNQEHQESDGGWPVTENIVKSIATNPAYIGWWLWGGELIHKNNHPPLINEETFWAVQVNLNGRRRGPNGTRGQKRQRQTLLASQSRRRGERREPFPLAGLLYCLCQGKPNKMHCYGSGGYRLYACRDTYQRKWMHTVSANYLDQAIGDFVLSQCAFPEYAAAVLRQLQDEYDQAKEKAAATAREVARLDQEVENLQHNFAVVKLTPERAEWLEAEIQKRMERKRELAQVDAYPVGRMVQAIGAEDVKFVRSLLSDLRQIWPDQTNEVKNTFLRLVLERIEVEGLDKSDAAFKATIYWRSGARHVIEVIIPRRGMTNQKRWTNEEDELIREHYDEGYEALSPRLPHRNWPSIVKRARKLGLRSNPDRVTEEFRRWSPKEDDVVREWIAGKLTSGEAIRKTGRTLPALQYRANKLGLKASERPAGWRLMETWENCEDNPGTGCRSHSSELS
jgi:DNA invertase Pin-like site-specific DNA recombinase